VSKETGSGLETKLKLVCFHHSFAPPLILLLFGKQDIDVKVERGLSRLTGGWMRGDWSPEMKE
jgi:hypothetical protein